MSNLDLNNLNPGDRYSFIKIRGKGSYGIVGEYFDKKTNQKVAIKKMHPIEDIIDAKRMLREIRILRYFVHDNLIHLFHIAYNHTNKMSRFGDVYLVLNLMDIDLSKIIKKSRNELTDEHIQFIMYQILRGMAYLHSANLVHRDIKPNNLLGNEDCEIRICDFGFAREVDEERKADLTEYVVTRFYRAPEVMLSSQQYNTQVDVWSIGCIFYELITGEPLFPCKNYFELIKIIIDVLGKPDSDEMSFISNVHAKNYIEKIPYSNKKKVSERISNYENKAALDLLDKLLVFDYRKRITCAQALRHDYFKDIFEEGDDVFPKIDLNFGFEYDDKLTLKDLKLMILNEINLVNKERCEEEIDIGYYSSLLK